MATLPTPQAPRSSAVGTLIVLALVLVLAYQLAYWTWVFLAPPPVTTPAAAAMDVDLAAVSRMFGAAPPGASNAASTSGLRLKGVVAPTPGTAASAIFATGSGRDLAVYVGHEVQPGVKLAAVLPDHVLVRRGGVDERIDLDKPRSGVTTARVDTQAAGFRMNVGRSGPNSFSFSRGELDDALRDPKQLSFLGLIGNPPGGGVRMDQAPPGSLAQKLGLQPGDVIKKVNGQVIASQGDLARIYTQFYSLNQVQAEIQRGTTTVQLSYAIQP